MTFIIIIAIVIFLFVSLLFVPITFEIYQTGSTGEKPKARIRIFPFHFINLNTGVKSDKKVLSSIEPKIRHKEANSGNILRYLLSDWDLLEVIVVNSIRLLIGLINCPDRYFFRMNLYGGLSQPHLTGQLYGMICAITPALPESINIIYQPDFSEESIRTDFNLNIKIHMAAILSEIIKFLFRLPAIRIIKLVWTYRKDSNYAYQN
jgi:hypothetical protein